MIGNYRIFALIFLPASLALVFGLALVQQKNKDLSAAQFGDQLRNQWRLVSIIQASSLDTEAFKEAGRSLGLRVTLVDRAGRVVFDSGSREEILEDHSQREEIRSAFLGVPAMATRRSATTGLYTIYYADRLGPDLVLRVAYPAEYYQGLAGALLAQTFSGLMALFAAVAVFALIVSRSTSRTLRELARAVDGAKNGSDDLPSFRNESLDSALYSLSAVTRELKEHGRRNAELSARLQYILANVQEGVILLQEDDIVYSNERASAILGHRLPGRLSEICQADLISLVGSLAGGEPVPEISIGGRTVTVSRRSDGPATLVILHDISDRLRYSGYKSELVANISHELKTPLSLIMASSEVIAGDPGMPRERLERFLQAVLGNARRLNGILDDLIFLHRLETGGPSAARSDLGEVVSEVADLVEPDGKRLNWRCDSGTVGVHPGHIASILTNLVTNALKYSSGPEIDVSVSRGDDGLTISVADGGPAIPLGERERIFERFYSLSASRSRENSGSGLGLSIVKHIARLYGGQARIVDNDRGGNTFVVSLTERA
ncbi:MAG: hypothetical protein LBP92_03030 [Deltaproteobacteria bacterium]|jgi:two-component system phosphate regulon sensor histidine kinase PhoR|nr:hypothetical protein [Deltaproteobacteria bacterium]